MTAQGCPTHASFVDPISTYGQTPSSTIFDTLIADLISLGPDAPEADKLAKFETAVIALNHLDDELDNGFIETGEREDLCELCNSICTAAGMDPTKYGDGEGPASEWREW